MAEHLQVTPSGVGILFEDGEVDPATGKSKRRCYRIAQLAPDAAKRLAHKPEDVHFLSDLIRGEGAQYPSVTTILGMLDKPGLPYAAEKLTVAGCIELATRGGLPRSVPAALGRLGREQLRFRQVWDRKADRGKLSHEDLVHLFAGRQLPALDTYAEDQRAFAMGVASFLADFRPRLVESEAMVASLEHGYSGRPDAVVELGVRGLPDGSGAAPVGRGLIDLKTHERLPRTKPSKTFPEGQVKTPYPENLLQLDLYEVARRESGYEPSDWRAVVSVDANGAYDFTVSWLPLGAALVVLPAYDVFKQAASRLKTAADQRPVEFENATPALERAAA